MEVEPFTVAVLSGGMEAGYNYSLRTLSGSRLLLLSFLGKKIIKEYGN